MGGELKIKLWVMHIIYIAAAPPFASMALWQKRDDRTLICPHYLLLIIANKLLCFNGKITS